MRDALSIHVLSVAMLIAGSDTRLPAAAAPARLAIYYGYPSLVNGAGGNLRRSTDAFAPYDVVVFGDGLEFDAPGSGAGPAEHKFTVALAQALRQRMPRPSIFGYVDLGRTQHLSLDEIERRVALWSSMGVDGIFFDEAGYDFGVTRERQNAAVTLAHRRGLRVCLNAFQPADVFDHAPVRLNAVGGGNPRGVAPVLTSRDAVLLEAFEPPDGAPGGADQTLARLDAASAGRSQYGSSIFAIANGLNAAAGPYAWWTAAAFGVDAFGWAASDYGAGPSRLSWMPRPPEEAELHGAHYLESRPVRAKDGWSRGTTAGAILIDPRTRTGHLRSR